MKKDWVECKLGDLLNLKNGFAFKAVNYIKEGVPVIRIGDINDWLVSSEKAVKIEESSIYDQYIVETGDILIAMSGATTGKFGVYNSNEKAYQNQRVGNLKIHSDSFINKSFIFYLLYSLKRDIEREAYGGAQPNISGVKIESLNTKLAPLPIQRAIVSKIEELFSDLDNGIANLKKAQEQLKVYRQAVLKKAFEGELTKEWREKQTNLPTADKLLDQIQKERENHYKQQLEDWKKAVEEWEENGKEGRRPTKPRKIKELPALTKDELKDLLTLPRGWMWSRVADIGRVETGSTPKRGNPRYWDNGNIPWITSGALNSEYVRECKEYVTDAALKETNVKLFPKRSLVMAMYGEGKTRGKTSELLIETTTNQAIACIIQSGLESQTRKYLKSFLLKIYQEIRRKSSGGVQPNINLNIVKNITIPLCSLPEQHQIVQEIESRLSVCDKLEESIEESLLKSEALRQSILKQAFEGKLLSEEEVELCKREKDYEPAHLLLERIKEEKKQKG